MIIIMIKTNEAELTQDIHKGMAVKIMKIIWNNI